MAKRKPSKKARERYAMAAKARWEKVKKLGLRTLSDLNGDREPKRPAETREYRPVSKTGHANMSAAAKARWARVRNGEPVVPVSEPPQLLSPADQVHAELSGRQRMRELAVKGAQIQLEQLDKDRALLEQFIKREGKW
jgi:hypothetical protein